jgi:hypothetical protein
MATREEEDVQRREGRKAQEIGDSLEEEQGGESRWERRRRGREGTRRRRESD